MKKLEKGFTLNELMIVVAIIGILAAVAAPRFGNQIQRARDSKGLAVISTWRAGANLYYSDKLKHAEKIGDLLKNVDTGTANATYKYRSKDVIGTDANVTGNTTGTAVHVRVGTGLEETIDTKKENIVEFMINGDGEIEIITSEKNSSEVEWNKL